MSFYSMATRDRLREVRYEIRGELARRAHALEAQGRKLIKLNIGNPGAFDFRAPDHLRQAIAENLEFSDAYTHQQGLPAARERLARHYRERGLSDVQASHIFIGNGVSELIDLSLRALLNLGDEVLLPSPDYPLWSAATILNDGIPRYYSCKPENQFLPDPQVIEQLIGPKTRALVIINPNNPTGASYPEELLREMLAIARKYRLLVFADEIYDGVVYGDAQFHSVAPLLEDQPCVSFGGLSKLHRACGWRVGWMALSGEAKQIDRYHHALDLLSALRLCANVPGQHAIEAALDNEQTISALTDPGGRLFESRQRIIDACASSEYLNLVAPDAALYAFPGVTEGLIRDFDDYQFAMDLLEQEDVLIVPGSSFNVPYRNHFRVTMLPRAEQIVEVFERIERLLQRSAQHGQGSSKAR